MLFEVSMVKLKYFKTRGSPFGTRSATISLTLKRELHELLKQHWRECVKAFFEAVAPHVAVDTGMSKASLFYGSSEVGADIGIFDGITKPGHKNLTGEWADNNAPYKSAALGMELGKKAYTVSYGIPSRPRFVFEFHIVVFQYFLHEASANYARSANWQSLEAGAKAFLTKFNSLPVNIVEFVLKYLE